MTQALERVIAEQQKEIDRLRALEESNADSWAKQYKRMDDLMFAVFGFMHQPQVPALKTDLQRAITSFGYCIICERRPCDCQPDYD